MKDNDKQFVFFGSHPLAIPTLTELESEGFIPSLIVTSPDRKQGRGMKTTSPAEKEWAENRDIEVSQPEKIDGEFISLLKSKSYTFAIVASYGKIIPQSLLDIFPRGIINVHPSLLPKYRGASPIRSQILNDEQNVGVTIMLMDALLDHGPILAQKEVSIEGWPIPGNKLDEILAEQGGKLLTQTIPKWLNGDIKPQEQNHSQATTVQKISKNDALISLKEDPYTNFLKIQAYDGWPRAFFYDKDKKRVVITNASCEKNILKIHSVIPEGKKEMSWESYISN